MEIPDVDEIATGSLRCSIELRGNEQKIINTHVFRDPGNDMTFCTTRVAHNLSTWVEKAYDTQGGMVKCTLAKCDVYIRISETH